MLTQNPQSEVNQNLPNQSILITGATGFLGGALTRRLVREGATVRVLVRDHNKASSLRGLGVEVVQGGITQPDAVARAIKNVQVVYHVAAALGGDYSTQRRTNIDGTRTVAEAAAIVNAHLIHVSTLSVYGNAYTRDVTEADPPAPGADPYAITKAAAEQIVADTAKTRGLRYTIIRPGMIYGPGSNMWTANAFRLAKLRPTPFFGDGQGRAPAVHVDDVIDLLLLAATHPAALNQTFNCVNDPAPTWREYIGAYQRLAGHDDWLPLPITLAYIVGGVSMLLSRRYSAGRDIPDLAGLLIRQSSFRATKAADVLGWRAQISINEGVASCADWLRAKGLL